MGFGTRDLNEGWRFALDPDGDPSRPDYPDECWQEVTLPHDWQIARRRDRDMPGGARQGYYPNEGIGWYRLRLRADGETARSAVRILFDGVQRFASVYVNGEEADRHAYGYTPWQCPAALREGDNVIAVRVDNSERKAEEGAAFSGVPQDRWYSGAGIFRPVQLDVRGEAHLLPDGIRVVYETDGAHVTGKAVLSCENRGPARSVRAGLLVTSPDGHTEEAAPAERELPHGACRLELPFEIENAAIWDIDRPLLYTFRACLYAGEELLDEREARTGFRTSRFDGDEGYFLNGRSLKLKGVNLHHDSAAFGAVMPRGVLRRRLEALKGIGCNAIRCSHNPKERFFYDLCDEMGFLVIDELYDKWRHLYFALLSDADRERDLDDWIARDANHPCVILWSVGNECPDQYSEPFFRELGALCAAVRERAPSRPVSYAQIGHNGVDMNDPAVRSERMEAMLRYASLVDVWMGNYMEGCYETVRRAGMKLPVIGSETFELCRMRGMGMDDPALVQAWNDVEDHPWVCGGFLWAGVDYLGESTGWPVRGWTGCPIDSAGFVKLRGEYTRSLWTDEPMVKIAVFSEDEPYDGARGWWGFPQMVPYWYRPRTGQMVHVAVFTNCGEVRLRENGGYWRTVKVDRDTRMAHFWVVYQGGMLEAEGLADGKAAARDELRSSVQAEKACIRICEKVVRAEKGEIFHAEAELRDRYGRPWTRERPLCRFSVEGPAEVAAVDNGDFSAEQDVYAAHARTLMNGHAVCCLRATGGSGTVRVTAEVEGYAPVTARIEIV